MRALTYRRVSTDKQVEKYSLSAQQKLCREFCEKHNWTVAFELVDKGYSGSLFEDRPDFLKMLSLVEQKLVDVVVTTDADRLARPDNLLDLGRLQKILIANNVKLATISGKIIDLSVDNDWFLSSLESIVAGYERKKIKERVIRGVRELKGQGFYWGTIVPSGYRRSDVDKRLIVPNPVRCEMTSHKGNRYTVFSADEVKYIYDMYLKGESINAIAKIMHSHDTTIAPILDRALFYAGNILSLKDDGAVLGKGKHEPLISEFVARKVLKLRSERQKIHQSNREKYPSLGLIRCGTCNSVLNLKMAMKPNKKYYYYICGSRKSKKAGDEHRCNLPVKQVVHIEDRVWQTVETILSKPESIFAMMTNANTLLEQGRDRLLKIEKELSELTGKRRKVMNLYENTKNDESHNELMSRYSEIEATISTRKKEKEEIASDIIAQEKAPKNHREILQTMEILQDIIYEANEIEKRDIIRLLFDSILLYPNGNLDFKVQIPICNTDTDKIVSQETETQCSSWTNCPSSSATCSKRSVSPLRTARSPSLARSRRSPIPRR